MRRDAQFAILITALAVVALVVVVTVVVTAPPSRVLSVDELRLGTSFTLGGVGFTVTGFADYQTGPIVDGGYVVTFHIAFADGTSENLDVGFGGYCPAGSASQVSTVHRGPMVTFHHACGEDSIRVTVLA